MLLQIERIQMFSSQLDGRGSNGWVQQTLQQPWPPTHPSTLNSPWRGLLGRSCSTCQIGCYKERNEFTMNTDRRYFDLQQVTWLLDGDDPEIGYKSQLVKRKREVVFRLVHPVCALVSAREALVHGHAGGERREAEFGVGLAIHGGADQIATELAVTKGE